MALAAFAGEPQTANLAASASTIPELMPNIRFKTAGGAEYRSSESVAVARVIDVRPGDAKVWETDDGQDVAFADPRADSRNWFVTIEVTELIAGNDLGKNLEIRIPGDGGKVDVDSVIAGLKAIDSGVFFLQDQRSFNIKSIALAWNGAALALVAEDGTLSFPALPPEQRLRIDEESFTVEFLRRLRSDEVQVIQLGEAE